MKNIGTTCAGIGFSRAFAKQKLAKLHARFDEGGQPTGCPLLYLLPVTPLPAAAHEILYKGAKPELVKENRRG